MKTIQRNKIKFKVFEEDELKYQLGMNDDDISLILEYQDKFPELLQEKEGFVIDGEKLSNQLEVKSNFNDWLLRKTKGKEGKLIKYRCVENTDFISISEKSEKPKGGRPNNKIMLTLECAKKIAMRQNNERGDLVCNYFILIEKTLRNYESWNKIRNPEKEKANEMRQEIKNWCERKGFDSTLETFYTREFNMLNQNLTNFKASELRDYFNCKTGITRDYLIEKYNSALLFIQEFNIQLLLADTDFETRKYMIKNVCNNKYKDLRIE